MIMMIGLILIITAYVHVTILVKKQLKASKDIETGIYRLIEITKNKA